MRQKLPIVLAVTALVVAVFGATPLGHAAGNVVKRALFATNAGKVNGIKASTTPMPNQLLPLGSDAKFPSSVIPSSSQGPLNSVGSDQVIDESLTGADIKDGSLTGGEIKDGSLTGAKLADNTVTGKQIDESTLPFQLKSNSVRIDALDISFGSTRSWDIGPYITLYATCYASGASHHFDQTLLNNAPTTGQADGGNLINKGTNPATPLRFDTGSIGSGQTRLLTSNADPPTTFVGTSNVVTFVWRDDSGETITGVYSTVLYANYCQIDGTLTRTT